MEEGNNNERQIGRFGKIMKKAKNVSIFVICVVVILGSIGMFFWSIVSDNSTIDNLSSFIGIILGIVALVTSIVSMLLSFYSIEKADESEKNTYKLLYEIKSLQQTTKAMVNRIDKKQEQINSYLKTNENTETRNIDGNSVWSEVKNDGND